MQRRIMAKVPPVPLLCALLLCPSALVSPAAALAADKVDARAMLIASTPAKDAVLETVPQQIELTFAEPAQVFSVTLRLPDDREVEAEPDADVTPGKARQFRFRLPELTNQPGSYSLSYLLVSKSFKSLNGFIHFSIAAQPEPDVPSSTDAHAE